MFLGGQFSHAAGLPFYRACTDRMLAWNGSLFSNQKRPNGGRLFVGELWGPFRRVEDQQRRSRGGRDCTSGWAFWLANCTSAILCSAKVGRGGKKGAKKRPRAGRPEAKLGLNSEVTRQTATRRQEAEQLHWAQFAPKWRQTCSPIRPFPAAQLT